MLSLVLSCELFPSSSEGDIGHLRHFKNRKPYSPTKSLVPPTILVRFRCRVRVRGSGLGPGFGNLVGGTRDLVGE